VNTVPHKRGQIQLDRQASLCARYHISVGVYLEGHPAAGVAATWPESIGLFTERFRISGAERTHADGCR